MRRIWHRLFAARPMAGPPTDSGWIGPSPNSCHHPFSCASRTEYTELLTMYALTRRKVLSQAEEIERLKAER